MRVVNPSTWLQRVLVESKKLRIYLLAQLQITDLVLHFIDFYVRVQEVGHVHVELRIDEYGILNNVSFSRNECGRIPTLLIYQQN